VPLPNLNPAVPIDLEQLVTILLPTINKAIHWSLLRYKGCIRKDELDDLSQEIILMLIEDNCRRLRSFNGQSSFETWLQEVVNHHIYKCFYNRKQIESLDEVDQSLLTYPPPLDQEIANIEKRNLLFIALNNFSQEERLLYRLWFLSELDAKEIATIFRTEVRIIYKRKQTLILKLTRLLRNSQSN
jgi:RNA polymerase sigma factor (sigma-70 family)